MVRCPSRRSYNPLCIDKRFNTHALFKSQLTRVHLIGLGRRGFARPTPRNTESVGDSTVASRVIETIIVTDIVVEMQISPSSPVAGRASERIIMDVGTES